MRERRFHHRKGHVTLKASDIDRKRTRLNEQSLLPNTCLQFAPEGLVQSGVALGLHWRALLEIDLVAAVSVSCSAASRHELQDMVPALRATRAVSCNRLQHGGLDVRGALTTDIPEHVRASWHPGILAPADTKLAMLQLGAPLRYIRKSVATAAKTVHVRPSSTTVHSVSQRARLGKKAAA